jgi:hypothetical protein
VEGEAKDGAYVCGRIGRPRIPGSASPRLFPNPWRPAGTRGWGTQLCTGHVRMGENWESDPPRVIRPRCSTSHLRIDGSRRVRAMHPFGQGRRKEGSSFTRRSFVEQAKLEDGQPRKGKPANAGKQTLPLPRNRHGDGSNSWRVSYGVRTSSRQSFQLFLPNVLLATKQKKLTENGRMILLPGADSASTGRSVLEKVNSSTTCFCSSTYIGNNV